MTTLQSSPLNLLLLDATEDLIRAHRETLPARDVIAAVARAKLHVDSGFAVIHLDPPPADEYVVLVVGLARQELIKRVK